jgi:hypothetical protein
LSYPGCSVSNWREVEWLPDLLNTSEVLGANLAGRSGTTSLWHLIPDRGDVQIACNAFVGHLFLYFSAAASNTAQRRYPQANKQKARRHTGLPALFQKSEF